MNRIIITGASSGIGKEMALLLDKKGNELVLVARRKKRLDSIRKRIKTKCIIFTADLSKEKDIERLIKKFSNADVLINNAGYSMYASFAGSDWKKQKDMVFTNSIAPARLMHHFIKAMKKKGKGRILNVSSTAGEKPSPFISMYGASKSFLTYLSESVSLELKGTGVSVSCLLPGPTKTEFWDVSGSAKKVAKARAGYDDPEKVAAFGIKLMEKGSIRGVPGIKNKIKGMIKFLMPRPLWYSQILKHMKHRSLKK